MSHNDFSYAGQMDAKVELDNLYPAIVQCFAVILCGYTAGRLGVISNSEVKGLNTFVGTFALPAVIFTSLVRLNLETVNWTFLIGIFIAKALVFFGVILVTCLIPGSMNTARAGLYAMFTTQTNDFALGVPIVQALYDKTHPNFVNYLYLAAPINLTILNPFGFILLEIYKSHTITSAQQSRQRVLLNVVTNIISNPIVFMSMLGMLCNFIFRHSPPELLFKILDVFASAFTATALFLLGLRMVGKVQTLHGTALIVPGILILVKLIIVPLALHQVVYNLLTAFPNDITNNGTANVETYSTFAFLYGTVPSAPGVFVYATAYNIDVELIASAMVACTFLSAPIMFISARLISLSKIKDAEYESVLKTFNTDICLVSLFASVWLVTSYVCQKNSRSKHFLNKIVNFLVISRIVSILSYLYKSYIHTTEKYVIFERGLSTFGDVSSFVTIPCLAVAVLLTACHNISLLLRLRSYFYILYLGVPSVYYLGYSIIKRSFIREESINIIVQSITLCLALVVTIACLVLTQRYKKKSTSPMVLFNEHSNNGHRDTAALAPNIVVNDVSSPSSSQYVDMINEPDYEEGEREESLLQHVILLILLCVSMFISLLCGIWYLELGPGFVGNIYVEMYFVENALRLGMPLIIFCVFAVDTKNIFAPIINKILELCYKDSRIQLVPWDQLSFETRHVCDQFIGYHLRKCKMDIAKDIRWNLILYKQSFTGEELITWMINNDISQDRDQAAIYADHLIQGRVLRHIQGTFAFQDSPYKLYTLAPSANSR